MEKKDQTSGPPKLPPRQIFHRSTFHNLPLPNSLPNSNSSYNISPRETKSSSSYHSENANSNSETDLLKLTKNIPTNEVKSEVPNEVFSEIRPRSRSSSLPIKPNFANEKEKVKKKKKGLFSNIFEYKTKKEFNLSISEPSNFRHESSIGWSSTNGFKITNIPQEWKKIFIAAGITKAELQDKDTAAMVVEIIKDHVGEEIPAQPPSELVLTSTNQIQQIQTNRTKPLPPSKPRRLLSEAKKISRSAETVKESFHGEYGDDPENQNSSTFRTQSEIPSGDSNSKNPLVNNLSEAITKRRQSLRDDEKIKEGEEWNEEDLRM